MISTLPMRLTRTSRQALSISMMAMSPLNVIGKNKLDKCRWLHFIIKLCVFKTSSPL